MGQNKNIPINFWDDFWDDGHIPNGEIQSTFAYVEDYLASDEDQKASLEILLEFLTKNSNELNLDNVKTKLTNTGQWEIKLDNITHEQLEFLVGRLQKSGLSYNNTPFHFYSES